MMSCKWRKINKHTLSVALEQKQQNYGGMLFSISRSILHGPKAVANKHSLYIYLIKYTNNSILNLFFRIYGFRDGLILIF